MLQQKFLLSPKSTKNNMLSDMSGLFRNMQPHLPSLHIICSIVLMYMYMSQTALSLCTQQALLSLKYYTDKKMGALSLIALNLKGLLPCYHFSPYCKNNTAIDLNHASSSTVPLDSKSMVQITP